VAAAVERVLSFCRQDMRIAASTKLESCCDSFCGELGSWLRLKELIHAILRGCIGVSRGAGGQGTGSRGAGQRKGNKMFSAFILTPDSGLGLSFFRG